MRGTLFILLSSLLFISCSKETIIHDEDIKQDLFYVESGIKPFSGICNVVYNDTTLVKEKLAFKDGKLCGKSVGYYKNGKIRWEGDYKNGFLDGLWRFYSENGNITCEVNFKKDSLDGTYRSWHVNGKLKEEGTYSMNKKLGKWIEFNSLGNIIQK